MIFLQAFLYSIRLPKKQAMFRLNRIGMDITVIYMFILIFFVSLPSFINRLTSAKGLGADMPFFMQLVYFFMFYYLPLTIMLFLLISLIAYIGTLTAKALNRKIRFAILWKMCAYTTTIPFLVYTIAALIFPVSDAFIWLFIIYSLAFMIKIITVYPKRKKRK
ncbi:DUF1189 family protein [Virgibacillus siamensis]|uniref:DUF1189 family protein n=1 Tax=Virgibacillus siamensis TaxID=480071 RepID=UPI00098623F3|nr:DUF1189 family protein [Virgibacillus siamensis]